LEKNSEVWQIYDAFALGINYFEPNVNEKVISVGVEVHEAQEADVLLQRDNRLLALVDINAEDLKDCQHYIFVKNFGI
jgi:hypothetical protein